MRPGGLGGCMRFARIAYVGAAVRGVAVLTPLYWLVDITGRRYPAPAEYPHFFYGFFSVALAWQIAFFVIGSNPRRFRPLMIPSVLEKLGHVITVAALYSQSRISAIDAQGATPDMLLGVLFVAAFVTTSPRRLRLHTDHIAQRNIAATD